VALAERLWGPRRVALEPIRKRVALGYWRPSGKPGPVRERLARALSDVTILLDEVERSWAARDGFLEAIGKGVLRVDPSPTGRRRLRELAEQSRAELADMNRSRDHGAP